MHSNLMITLFLLTALAWAQTASPADEKPSYETVPDIPYRADDGTLDAYALQQCRLDLYYPAGKKDFPTIVWFHGGGLTGGKKSIPERLKNQNVAVAAVGYRLSPQVQTAVCIQDAAAAVAWVFKHIKEYGGSRQRIFVSGHSAGGYLTSMLGLDPRWLKEQEMEANDLAGLIPFSGHTITHFTTRKEHGIPDKQPVIDDMAPLYHVRQDAPPILLITGDRELELLGRYEENAYFWRMLKVAGHPDVTLYELDGYDHGGMADPGFPLLLKFVRRIAK